MNKQLQKIRGDLEAKAATWKKEAEEGNRQIADARARLETANARLEAAEDAADYAAAQKEIADIQIELSFYEKQNAKHKHVIEEAEYNGIKQLLDAEKASLLVKYSDNIRKAFFALSSLLDEYDAEAVELATIENKLKTMSNREPALIRGDSIRKLSNIEGTQRIYDNFADFVDYYAKRKQTRPARKAAGGKE